MNMVRNIYHLIRTRIRLKKKFVKIILTSLSRLSLLNNSSVSNLAFWLGTTLGILKRNLGRCCSNSPIPSNGSTLTPNPPVPPVCSLIVCIILHGCNFKKRTSEKKSQKSSRKSIRSRDTLLTCWHCAIAMIRYGFGWMTSQEYERNRNLHRVPEHTSMNCTARRLSGD